MTRWAVLLVFLALSGCAGAVAAGSMVAGVLSAAAGLDEALIDSYHALKGNPVGTCATVVPQGAKPPVVAVKITNGALAAAAPSR